MARRRQSAEPHLRHLRHGRVARSNPPPTRGRKRREPTPNPARLTTGTTATGAIRGAASPRPMPYLARSAGHGNGRAKIATLCRINQRLAAVAGGPRGNPHGRRSAASARRMRRYSPAERGPAAAPAYPAGDCDAHSCSQRDGPFGRPGYAKESHDRSRPHRRAVLRPDRHGPRPRREASSARRWRHGRRRAVPRIQPVRERLRFDDGRIKSAVLRHGAGLRPARACRARRPATPMPPSSREAAIRRAGETVRAVQAGHGGTLDGAAARHQPAASIPTPIRWRRSISRPRPSCWPRSTPMRAPRTRACARSSASLAGVVAGGADHPPRRHRASADIRPLVRLNVSVVVGDGDRMETGSSGAGGRVAYAALFRSGALAARRSTRRCARRWSISARCRRRPAR